MITYNMFILEKKTEINQNSISVSKLKLLLEKQMKVSETRYQLSKIQVLLLRFFTVVGFRFSSALDIEKWSSFPYDYSSKRCY